MNPCSISFSCVSRLKCVLPNSVSSVHSPGCSPGSPIISGAAVVFHCANEFDHCRTSSGFARSRIREPASSFSRATCTAPVNNSGSICASRCNILRAIANASCTTSGSVRAKYESRSNLNCSIAFAICSRALLTWLSLPARDCSNPSRTPRSCPRFSAASTALELSGVVASMFHAASPSTIPTAALLSPVCKYRNGSDFDAKLPPVARSDDIRLLFLCLEYHLPLRLEAPRYGHDLLLCCRNVSRAHRPECFHVFLQHFHRPRRHALEKMIAQIFRRRLQRDRQCLLVHLTQ